MKKKDECDNDTEFATLGVDGLCGYALLGIDIVSGEAEFVEICCNKPRWTKEWIFSARIAAGRAFSELKKRLRKPNLDFRYDQHLDDTGAQT